MTEEDGKKITGLNTAQYYFQTASFPLGQSVLQTSHRRKHIANSTKLASTGLEGEIDAIPFTFCPSRVDAEDPPQSFTFRKYACVDSEGAQDESLPP